MNTHPSSSVAILQHKLSLLRKEYEYEKETFKQQTEVMGISRKIKRGMCWYPVALGRSYYNSLNQLVIEVIRQEDKEIEHVFEYGKPVVFFTQDFSGNLHYLNFTATVNYVEDDRMVVILPNPESQMKLQLTDGKLGVQLYFDESTYKLMFEAMNRVIEAKQGRLAELRELFHGTAAPQNFTFGMTRFPPSYTVLPERERQRRWSKPSTRFFIARIKYWYAHKATWLSTGSARN